MLVTFASAIESKTFARRAWRPGLLQSHTMSLVLVSYLRYSQSSSYTCLDALSRCRHTNIPIYRQRAVARIYVMLIGIYKLVLVSTQSS